MKRIIRFSRFFIPAAIISVILTVVGITGYIVNDGFNLGVDFQAGLIQEVQFAPSAFTLKWLGTSNATLSFDRNNIFIVVSGAGIEGGTYTFPFNEYSTVGSLTREMTQQLEDLEVSLLVGQNISTQWLKFSTQSNPYLSDENPYVVHYLDPNSPAVSISDVRGAMASFGQTVSVQNIGQPSDRQFMIRIQDVEGERIRPEEITRLLESYFGSGEIVIVRSDYVGSRFSKDLTDQAGVLMTLTLLLILIYCIIRFKLQYAVGAVIAIIYDGIIVVSFIALIRMEFTTSTIAAILTILGYSTNDTIVVFDRIREVRKLYPEDSFVDVLNRSLTATLNRTIITTLSTMLAVVCLYIFTVGSMKDFALALMVGLISGVYTTTFITSGFIYFWEVQKEKREKRKLALAAAKA